MSLFDTRVRSFFVYSKYPHHLCLSMAKCQDYLGNSCQVWYVHFFEHLVIQIIKSVEKMEKNIYIIFFQYMFEYLNVKCNTKDNH